MFRKSKYVKENQAASFERESQFVLYCFTVVDRLTYIFKSTKGYQFATNIKSIPSGWIRREEFLIVWNIFFEFFIFL